MTAQLEAAVQLIVDAYPDKYTDKDARDTLATAIGEPRYLWLRREGYFLDRERKLLTYEEGARATAEAWAKGIEGASA